MQSRLLRHMHFFIRMVKQIVRFAAARGVEDPVIFRPMRLTVVKGVAHDAGVEVDKGTSATLQLLQVVTSKDYDSDSSSSSSSDNCKYIESEPFGSEDDLEVMSEPIVSKTKPSHLGYRNTLPMCRNTLPVCSHHEPSMSTGTNLRKEPVIVAPTKFLLETLNGGQLTVLEKVAKLQLDNFVGNPRVKACTVQVSM